MSGDLPDKPRTEAVGVRHAVAGWLQEMARELIVSGSTGMAKTVALDQLRARGIEPTEQQFQEIDLELRKKGEEFAQRIMNGGHHDNSQQSIDDQ